MACEQTGAYSQCWGAAAPDASPHATAAVTSVTCWALKIKTRHTESKIHTVGSTLTSYPLQNHIWPLYQSGFRGKIAFIISSKTTGSFRMHFICGFFFSKSTRTTAYSRVTLPDFCVLSSKRITWTRHRRCATTSLCDHGGRLKAYLALFPGTERNGTHNQIQASNLTVSNY